MKLDELKRLLSEEDKNETKKIENLLFKFRRNWVWFVISTLICIIGAVVYSQFQEYMYRVSSVVVIKEKEGQNSSIQAQLDFIDNMNILGGKNKVSDEVYSFSSKTLLKRVVNDLGIYTSYYQKNGLRKTDLYHNTPILVSMPLRDIEKLDYPVEVYLKQEKNGITAEIRINKGWFDTYRSTYSLKKLPATIQTPEGKVEISRSSNIPFRADDQIIATITQPIYEATLLKNALSIEQTDKNANTVNIFLATSNIEKGRDVIEKIISYYNIFTIEEKNKIAQGSLKFINERLKLIEDELSDVEKKVESYKQNNKLTNIEAESDEFIKQNSDYERLLSEAETQINLVDFVHQYLLKDEDRYGVVPNIGIADENLSNLLREYNSSLLNRERLIRTTSEKNPVIIDIERQIKSLRSAILASVESTKKSLVIRKRNLNQQNSLVSYRIKNVPRQEREYLNIKRQQDLKSTLYTYLLQKREENNIKLALSVPAASIVEEPLLDLVLTKGVVFYVIIAFILGLFFPAAVIFIQDRFSKRITDKIQLEKLTSVTILGELPDYKSKEVVVIKPDSFEPITEMYRLLRTNLEHLLNEKSYKVINITSTELGEGKTSFAINMALTLAMAGKKTLVTGLDIRRPALSDFIKSPDTNNGITSYLKMNNKYLNDLIQSSNLHENLYILPCGETPSNPNELLLNKSLDEVFSLLRNEFDYILIDTAPVGIVADTFLINRVSDLTLYIFRANYSNINNAKIINDIAKQDKLKNLYIILKGCDLKSHPYRYVYKKYGYYSKKI